MKPFTAKTLALLAGLTVTAAELAEARDGPLQRLIAERMAGRQQDGAAPQAAAPQSIAYGSDSQQVLDVWPARHASDPAMAPAPLVIFVHGGGWKRGSKDNAAGSWKQVHYPAAGFVYAAIDYRLVPAATVEQQAADVAQAVKALLDRAGPLGIDPNRVVLMGHSAGAHLVALVGTDERYLQGAGLSFRNLAGVIAIDGAAYDVPRQITGAGRFMHDTYLQAFGSDPARQQALSPALQAAAPNAPAFLLLHVQRADGIAQAKELEAALRQAGTGVERKDFPGTGLQGHAEINRRLGDPDYAATPVVDGWLRQVFAR